MIIIIIPLSTLWSHYENQMSYYVKYTYSCQHKVSAQLTFPIMKIAGPGNGIFIAKGSYEATFIYCFQSHEDIHYQILRSPYSGSIPATNNFATLVSHCNVLIIASPLVKQGGRLYWWFLLHFELRNSSDSILFLISGGLLTPGS